MLRSGRALAATAAASVLVGYAVRSLLKKLGERKEGAVSARAVGTLAVAQRALALLGKAPPCYIEEHIKCLISGDAFHVTRSPEGYICLAISENRVSFSLLQKSLQESRPSGITTTGYDDPRGGYDFRVAVASMLSEHFQRTVEPQHLYCSAGATGVISALFFVLCDRGQGVLIPAPYFTGFDGDLRDPRIGAVPMPFYASPSGGAGDAHIADIDALLSNEVLERAYLENLSQGAPPRVLLLTNPHNPSGRCYGGDALRGAIAWAATRGLQVVVDEVYAGSFFGDSSPSSGGESSSGGGGEEGGTRSAGAGAKYTPVASLFEPLPAHVHVVWGFSKDFGIAGWRVGVLFTENASVGEAFGSLLHTQEASTDTLHTLRALLTHPDLSGGKYHAAHRRLLAESYRNACRLLKEVNIKWVPASAGLFLMIDLRRFLKGSSWAAEDDLWRYILTQANVNLTPEKPYFFSFLEMNPCCPASVEAEDNLWCYILTQANVNLTPGGAMHCQEAGWFRLCFASQTPDVVSVALRRLGRVLAFGAGHQTCRDVSVALRRLGRCLGRLEKLNALSSVAKEITHGQEVTL